MWPNSNFQLPSLKKTWSLKIGLLSQKGNDRIFQSHQGMVLVSPKSLHVTTPPESTNILNPQNWWFKKDAVPLPQGGPNFKFRNFKIFAVGVGGVVDPLPLFVSPAPFSKNFSTAPTAPCETKTPAGKAHHDLSFCQCWSRKLGAFSGYDLQCTLGVSPFAGFQWPPALTAHAW